MIAQPLPWWQNVLVILSGFSLVAAWAVYETRGAQRK